MFETHTSGNKKIQERFVPTLEYFKSQSGTVPSARRSKRPLLAYCTGCKCSMETSCNVGKNVIFGDNVQISNSVKIGVIYYQ